MNRSILPTSDNILAHLAIVEPAAVILSSPGNVEAIALAVLFNNAKDVAPHEVKTLEL